MSSEVTENDFYPFLGEGLVYLTEFGPKGYIFSTGALDTPVWPITPTDKLRDITKHWTFHMYKMEDMGNKEKHSPQCLSCSRFMIRLNNLHKEAEVRENSTKDDN